MSRPAEQLVGYVVGTGWTVIERIQAYQGQTGGSFSIGYIVQKGDQRGFMKAMDYQRAVEAPDLTKALQQITTEILFERDVLATCVALSRVVRLHETGRVFLNGHENNLMAAIEFFVFELADGDIRRALTFGQATDLAWKLRVLHHVAVGINQLHAKGIAHQDIKPSNVLQVKDSDKTEGNFKLGDLGRACVQGRDGPFDSLYVPGDQRYTPLETYYGYRSSEWVNRRAACDCYLLGSLVSFLFVGAGMTQLILLNLDKAHYPGQWQGREYADALPVLIDAHDKAISEVAVHIPDPLRGEIVQILMELSHPDPEKRGDARARRQVGRPVGFDRYISRFDLLRRKADIAMRLGRAA